MMNYFQTLTLDIDFDISPYFIWSKIYQQIHFALVELPQQDGMVSVGCSFPDYDANRLQNAFGLRLCVFSTNKSDLENLNLQKHLAAFDEYFRLSTIEEVDPNAIKAYAAFKRVQLKSNTPRLARRYAKRHNISYEDALAYYNDFEEKRSKLPFLQFKSTSKDQRFRLIIEKVEYNEPQEALFTTYGLSKGATVPII